MRRRRWTRTLLGAVLLAACARSVEDWRELLHSDEPFERQLAVIALGQTQDPAVVEDVFGALVDEDVDVAQAARDALAGMGAVAVPRLLDALATRVSPGERSRLVAATLLTEMGAAAVPPMIDALHDPVRYARAPIALTLGRIGRPAAQPLAGLLASGEVDLATVAARGLAECGRAGRSAVPALAAAVSREEPAVVVAAASALYAIGPDMPQALSALLARARTTEGEAHEVVLRAAVRGLLLQRLAAADDAERRRVHDEALRLGSEAIGGLIVALKFEQDDAALLAADWLGELGPVVLEPLIAAVGERNLQHIERVSRVVRRVGPGALPVLLALCRHEEPSIRIKAVTAIAALGQDGVQAMPELLELFDDDDLNVGVAAAWALAQMVPPDEALLERVLAAMRRPTAMARTTLMPCAVKGLLARIESHPEEGDRRLDQLLALGEGAVAVLHRLRDGNEAGLGARADWALRTLAGR
jgi:HEAT repeat protein